MLPRPSSVAQRRFPSAAILHWAILSMAMGTAVQAQADAKLRLAYGVEPQSGSNSAAIVPSPDTGVPLRLEYELVTRIERMAGTTRELRAIVEALPGPDLSVEPNEPVTPATAYATPLEETLARLNHIEQLIADITRLVQAMPFTAIEPGRPRPTVATPSAPAAEPQPPAKPAQQPPPQPSPPMAPEPSGSALSGTAIRSIALAAGGLLASVLAIVLRRQFLRRRPSRKDLAASIETPPLRDEALELADVMTEMGLADGAAQALAERIQANPRQSLSHWLKLLDVYRKSGKRDAFENAAEEIRSAFNVKPDRWEGPETGDRNASLENYPHIAAQLKKLWPTTECSEYLLSLLADNRDGKRSGFPLSVVEEIVLLLAVLRAEEG